MESRIKPDQEFKDFIVELHQKKYSEKCLSFVSYLAEFIRAEAVSDWQNRDTSSPLKYVNKSSPDDIIREAIKEEKNFNFVAVYITDILNDTYRLMESLPSNFNVDSDAWDYIGLGVRKRENKEKIINLSGSGIYPCNLKNGLENIFHKLTYQNTYDNLFVGLKLIHPDELDISNIWAISGFDKYKDYDIIPKAIVAARPKKLCMRNAAIVIASMGCPSQNIIFNKLAKAIAIAEVHTLDLSWNLLCSTRSSSLFKELKQNKTKIKNLNLGYNFLDQFSLEDWNGLKELIIHNQITHLNIAGNFFTHNFNFDSLISILDCDSLCEIDLSQNRLHELSDDNWQKLIKVLKKPNFKQIWIDKQAPEFEGCSLSSHFLSIEKNWGVTSTSMAVFGKGDKYFTGKNELTLQRRKDILQIIKWDLQEQAAFTFWKTKGAKVGHYNGSFFAVNDECKITRLEVGVAKILCEYANVEPDEWDDNTYQKIFKR